MKNVSICFCDYQLNLHIVIYLAEWLQQRPRHLLLQVLNTTFWLTDWSVVDRYALFMSECRINLFLSEPLSLSLSPSLSLFLTTTAVQPLVLRDWELKVHFKIHGLAKKNLNGDGMAIWLTKDRMQDGRNRESACKTKRQTGIEHHFWPIISLDLIFL